MTISMAAMLSGKVDNRRCRLADQDVLRIGDPGCLELGASVSQGGIARLTVVVMDDRCC
jgi:hypothetical protein